MKNNILLLVILFALCLPVKAQLLEDGVVVQAGLQTGFFAGNDLFNNNGVIAPSFYRNFNSNIGMDFSQTFRLAPLFSTGYRISFLSYGDWESPGYDNFTGSQVMSLHFAPLFSVHTRFHKTGLFNKLKVYGSVAPVLSLSRLKILNHTFVISGSPVSTGQFVSNYLFPGFEVGGGVKLAITNQWGVFLDLSLQESFVKSPFYNDTNASLLKVSLGVNYTIEKQKRFNY